jgi:hypothetical protein
MPPAQDLHEDPDPEQLVLGIAAVAVRAEARKTDPE